jgi:hypothetical protein
VLVTTWKTLPVGRVRDASRWDRATATTCHTAHPPQADDDAEHMLVRTVECIDGRRRSNWSANRLDYGRTPRNGHWSTAATAPPIHP